MGINTGIDVAVRSGLKMWAEYCLCVTCIDMALAVGYIREANAVEYGADLSLGSGYTDNIFLLPE